MLCAPRQSGLFSMSSVFGCGVGGCISTWDRNT